MPYTTVTIQEEDTFTTNVQENDLVQTSTSLYNIPAIPKLETVGDVDTTSQGKLDGSVLVYDTSTNKWVSTKLLEKQIMNGGFF